MLIHRSRTLIGIVLSAAIALFALGCSGNGSTSTSGSQTTPAESSAEHDLDAELVLTYWGTITTLDPHREPTNGVRPYWYPVYDTLFDVSTGSPEPRLVETFEHSADGLTWTFNLRSDVKFHDGTPLDAAAVVTSLDRARTLPESTVRNDLKPIVSVTAATPYQVVIVTDVYSPHLPSVLGGPAGAILNPTAIAAGNDFGTTPQGSGAYVVTSFVANQQAVYKRAADPYWDPKGGQLAGFTITYVGDFQTALNGFQSGQYDIPWVVGNSEKVEAAANATGAVIHKYEAQGPESLYLNNTRGDLSNPKVRQAINHAIDREGIAAGLYRGGKDCTPITQMLTRDSDPMHVDGLNPYAYDPGKAKALLEEAGAVGTSIELSGVGSTTSRNNIQAIQPMLEAAGFKVTVNPGAATTPVDFQQAKADTFQTTFAPQAHPLLTLNRYFLPGGAYHVANSGEDADLQALVKEARTPGKSEAELDRVYQSIGEEIGELSLIVPICLPTHYQLANKNVVNLEPNLLTFPDMRFVAVVK